MDENNKYSQFSICAFFIAITLLAPYLHQFPVVVQIMKFFGAILDKFAFNLVLIQQQFFLKIRQKKQLIIVLFWTNLVSTKA